MSETGLRQGVPTRGMRIATPCANQVEFIEAFHRYCEDNSFFVSTLTMRQIGLVSAFSVDLTDGRSMLRGYGVVLDAWPTAENRFGRPGVHIGIHKLTADSQAVFDQLLIARAVTSDRKAEQKAARTMTRQLWAITPAPLPTIPTVTPRATPSPIPPRTTTQLRGAGSSLAIVVPVVRRVATPPVVPRAVTPPAASRVVTPPAPLEASEPVFDQEGPTDTVDPRDALAAMPPQEGDAHESAVPTAAAAHASEPVTFEAPTRTASPTYAATLASERAARDRAPIAARRAAMPVIDDADDDAPTRPPAEPAPLPPLAYEPPHRPSPAPPQLEPTASAFGAANIAATSAAPHIALASSAAAPSIAPSAPARPSPFATPLDASARRRSWWWNPRLAAVFIVGIAVGFGIDALVRSPESAPPRPVVVPRPALPPTPAPPPAPIPAATAVTAAPKPTPPTAASPAPPTATPSHVAPARPIAKPAPARPVAKPVRPIAKPIVRPVRPKSPAPVAKPKCDGLSCI